MSNITDNEKVYMSICDDKKLTISDLSMQINKNLKLIENLNLLERYAAFMLEVQLIEQLLRNVLIAQHVEQVEKLTLGMIICELEKRKCNQKMLDLLRGLNGSRKDMAHSFLATDSILRNLVKLKSDHLLTKPLNIALFKVEETLCVYQFLTQNKFLFNETKL